MQINKFGQAVSWDFGTANQYDGDFRHLIEDVEEHMIVFADSHFHNKEGDPPNLKICRRNTWNDRMVIETVLSMQTAVSNFKKVFHRTWEQFRARLAYTTASFNILSSWYGLIPDENGFVPLSIAEFSL